MTDLHQGKGTILVDLKLRARVMFSPAAKCLTSVSSLKKSPKVEASCVCVAVHEKREYVGSGW